MRRQWSEILASSPDARHFLAIPERQQVRQILAHLLAGHPHVETTGAADRVWRWAGTDAHGWKLAAFNDSTTPACVTLARPEAFDYQPWDSANGTSGPWHSGTGSGDAGAAHIQLWPMELLTVRLRPARQGSGADADGDRAPAGEPGSGQLLTSGWALRIPGLPDEPVPIRTDRGWEQQGYPAYSGVGDYACSFDRHTSGPQRLRFPKVSSAVEVTLNGEMIGTRAWEPYEFELPELPESGNLLEVAVFSTAANKYYDGTPYRQHPEPSGVLAVPVIVSI